MNRRDALVTTGLIPAMFAAGDAKACSLIVDGPEEFAMRLPMVSRIFDAWFARDELRFFGHMLLASPEHRDNEMLVRAEMAESNDQVLRKLFDTMFTNGDHFQQVNSITAISDKVFVSVSEHASGGIGPDCSNLPTLHLFLLTLRQRQASSLCLIESNVWTGFEQTAHWSV